MVQRLRLHLLPVTARASHFHLRPGSAILQLVVPLVTVKADSPSDFPRLAREKGSRPVVAAVVFSARSSPEVARFVFVPCPGSICFAIADLVIAAADPFSLVRSDLAAAVGSVGFAAGSVVAAVGLSVAVDSAATVFVAAGPDFAVDLACSVVGSVCSFAAETGKGKGRVVVVVAISCSLIPQSSF